MKKHLILAATITAAFSLASCVDSGDDTVILETNVKAINGIPSDDAATAAPVIDPTEANTYIPNITYTTDSENGAPVFRIDLTGIQSHDGTNWLRLAGTGMPGQNVWVDVDGKPKGILVHNTADDQTDKKAPIDLVFTIDNSGSMSEEANAVARDVVAWAKQLTNAGLDIRFGCVGFSVYGTVNGGINLGSVDQLSSFLNRSTGTSRTVGFVGTDASTLQNKANAMGSTADECGAMAVRFADQNYSFRRGANRIYVNFTDEGNQPRGNGQYSVEFFKSQNNWGTMQGTIHSVLSEPSFANANYNWSSNWEDPSLMSKYTGGTTLYCKSNFSDAKLSTLPVTGAMMNSYIIKFANIDDLINDGKTHKVRITIQAADGTKAYKDFYVQFVKK